MAWSKVIYQSVTYNLYLGIGIFTTLIISLAIKTNTTLYRIFYIWYFILFAQLLLAFLEIFYGVHISNSRYYGKNINIPTGFFNNENDFATFIVLSLPILFIFSKKKNILINLFILFFSIFVIFETSSRTNIITLFFLMILYLEIYKKKKISLMLITLAFIFLAYKYEFLFNLIENARILDFIDESIIIRFNNILLSVKALIQSYMFGVGAGGMENFILNNSNYGIKAVHNWYFEILGNHGLIIFIGYLIFIFFSILSLVNIINKANNKLNKKIATILLFSNIGFLFGCVSMSTVIHFLPYWILLGVTLCFINNYRQGVKYL
ncbi:O-antigen ligase family protein [Arcobacter sp. CECT 8986]|uniref:O-antigen ligase family protein n=1 Tax=Arcobacter sp. CECT 8986 TaxID=2044507 RepID=UPI002159DF58|nr:O-antigen ligase family protein [Arcobacter sp. CECT 8986]